MQTAKTGDTVVVSYTVRTNDGQVVGGTDRDGPQTLTIGGKQIFPEIETALAGMTVGEEKAVTIPSDNAFGPRRDEMVIEIPRDQLPPNETPQPGMSLAAQQQDGSTINMVIVSVDENTVTADANHPLAGQDLQFGLKLEEIKDAA